MGKRIRVLLIALALTTGWLCAGSSIMTCQAHALSLNVKCEVYSVHPSQIVAEAGDKITIKKVDKYSLTVKKLKTLANLKSVLKTLKARRCSAASFKWVSKNSKIAKVTRGGRVTALKRGTTYIYPVPQGVYGYQKFKKYILYTDVSFLTNFKISGGFGTKITVT